MYMIIIIIRTAAMTRIGKTHSLKTGANNPDDGILVRDYTLPCRVSPK